MLAFNPEKWRDTLAARGIDPAEIDAKLAMMEKIFRFARWLFFLMAIPFVFLTIKTGLVMATSASRNPLMALGLGLPVFLSMVGFIVAICGLFLPIKRGIAKRIYWSGWLLIGGGIVLLPIMFLVS